MNDIAFPMRGPQPGYPQPRSVLRLEDGAANLAARFAALGSTTPSAAAIVMPGLPPLRFAELQKAITALGALLQDGVGPLPSRVGVALPLSPELAVGITAAACHGSAVPLSPAMPEAELRHLFDALALAAVIVERGTSSAARDLARRRGLAVIDAVQGPDGRMSWGLDAPCRLEPTEAPAGEAIVFQTSGTTGRPKLVPTTHANLFAMAERIARWLGVNEADRSLVMAPLYYAHAVKISLLVPLLLGGSVVSPARQRKEPLDCIVEEGVTWLTAGPVALRALLDRARCCPAGSLRHRLRFMQSGGAPLPAAVRRGIENAFGVPVIEYYGLSEAGQVAGNPLPPAQGRPGTAGRLWPGELKIVADDGATARPGEMGEIVVRGPTVMPGYIAGGDPTAWRDGWLRTGDIGRLEDGFLVLGGRLKDIINRGGEKVAPLDVEAALVQHPCVAEAAVFAVPHPRLGEDVAAAVVCDGAEQITPGELRQFLRGLISPFKIPRRIVFVADLPRTAAGKIDRADLARRFAEAETPASAEPPQSATEIEVAAIWKHLLQRDDIGLDDDFFEKGGDSLLAVTMLLEVEALTGRRVPEDALFEAATVRHLVTCLVAAHRGDPRPVLELQPGSDRPPFFFFHGDLVGDGSYTRRLVRLLGPGQPFYALPPHGTHERDVPSTIEAMAQTRLAAIRAVRPHGPYRIGGYCNGALVAYETARQLIEAGERVEAVVMIDALSLNARPWVRALHWMVRTLIARILLDPQGRPELLGVAMARLWRLLIRGDAYLELARHFLDLPAEQRRRKMLSGAARALTPWRHRGRQGGARDAGAAQSYFGSDEAPWRWDSELYRATLRAQASYLPKPLATRVLCYVGSLNRGFKFGGQPWKGLDPGVEVIAVAGRHATCVTTELPSLAARLRHDLDATTAFPLREISTEGVA